MKKTILLLLVALQFHRGSSQNLVWSEVVHGTGDQFVEDMASDHEGNVYVTGAFNSTVNFGDEDHEVLLTSDYPDIFIACYHENELQWVRQIGASAASSGLSIEVVGDEGVIVTGAFSGTASISGADGDIVLESAGSYDMFIARLDEDGDFLWARVFGGPGADEFTDIVCDNEAIWVCGSLMDWADLTTEDEVNSIITAGGYDGVVMKFDHEGHCMAANTIGGSGFDKALTISKQSNGHLLVAGHFRDTMIVNIDEVPLPFTSLQGSDVFLLSMNSICEIAWLKTFGTMEHDEAFAGAANGELFLAGKLEGVMDMDPGEAEFLLTSEENTRDMYLCSLSDSGDFLWAKQVSSSDEIVVRDIYAHENCGISIAGYFKGTVDFDPEENEVNRTSANQYADPFMCNYDMNGALNWTQSLQGNGSDYGNSILPTEEGFYLGGSFSDDIDLDPGIDLETSSSPGTGSDLFIIQLEYELSSGLAGQTSSLKPFLYPNPTSGNIHLKLLTSGDYVVKIFTNTGQLFREEFLHYNGIPYPLEIPQTPGIYQILMYDRAGKIYSEKIIKT